MLLDSNMGNKEFLDFLVPLGDSRGYMLPVDSECLEDVVIAAAVLMGNMELLCDWIVLDMGKPLNLEGRKFWPV